MEHNFDYMLEDELLTNIDLHDILLYRMRNQTLAKANYVYLSGKGYWMHRLFEPEEYKGVESWSMQLYPDPKSVRIMDAAKLQQKRKQGDEGMYINLKRKVKKPWKLRPKESPDFDPPVVVDADGKAWPDDKLLGNGSEVTVKLEVYDSANGRGSRLESVRIDKWIEYHAPDGDAPEDSDDDILPF